MSQIITNTVLPSQTFQLTSGCACQVAPCIHTTPTATRVDPFTTNLLSVEVLRAFLIHVTGRVKTIIDATISPTEHAYQNKALKDVLRTALWEPYGNVVQWSHREADRLAGLQSPDEFWPLKFGSYQSESSDPAS